MPTNPNIKVTPDKWNAVYIYQHNTAPAKQPFQRFEINKISLKSYLGCKNYRYEGTVRKLPNGAITTTDLKLAVSNPPC